MSSHPTQPKVLDELVGQFLANAAPKTVFNLNGLLDELNLAFAERALNAEMDHHLDGEDGGGKQAQRLWPQDGDDG